MNGMTRIATFKSQESYDEMLDAIQRSSNKPTQGHYEFKGKITTPFTPIELWAKNGAAKLLKKKISAVKELYGETDIH